MVLETMARANDERVAFSLWVEPYLSRMALIAARLGRPGERDDIVQEALLRAWRKRHQFDARRGDAASWLFAITANAARSSHRFRHILDIARRPNEDEDLESRMDLSAAIRRLPARQRLAIECHYAIGLTTAETAAVMGCSEGTAKSTLHDARGNLKRVLLNER